MADFDPDKYLTEKTSAEPFDPDKYLSEKGGESAAPEGHPGAAAAVGAMTGANLLPLSWLGGAAETLKSIVQGTHPELSVPEKFQRGAESWREVQRRAGEQEPTAYYGAALGTGLLAPMPGGSETAAARVGGAALQAGLQGAGEAKTLKELPGYAAGGAALGAGAAGLGEAVGAGLGRLRGAATGLRQAADAAAESKAAGLVDEEIGSVKGKLGSATQKGSRYLENLGREGAQSNTPALRNAARAALVLPEAGEIRTGVLQGNIADLGPVAAERKALISELAQKQAARGADIASKKAEMLANPIRKQVVPRVVRYGAPLVGGYLGRKAGEATGHPDIGMATGALAGGIAGGQPGTSLSNAAKNPAVRKMVGQIGEAVVRKSAPAITIGIGHGLAPMAGRSEELHRLIEDLFPDEPDEVQKKKLQWGER